MNKEWIINFNIYSNIYIDDLKCQTQNAQDASKGYNPQIMQ
jgi:hypothetical protein